MMFQILSRITENTCRHEFAFEGMRIYPTCVSTHHISKCLYCNCNYNKILDNVMSKQIVPKDPTEKYYKTPFPHFHIWREDGTCGSLLCFPYKENGDNYGYDYVNDSRISNKNRNCKCKRKKILLKK
jgi:hypothetical protein